MPEARAEGPRPSAGLFPSRNVECAIGVLPAIGVDQPALDIDVALDGPLVGGWLLVLRGLVVLVRQERSSLGRFHPLGLNDETGRPSAGRSGCLIAISSLWQGTVKGAVKNGLFWAYAFTGCGRTNR